MTTYAVAYITLGTLYFRTPEIHVLAGSEDGAIQMAKLFLSSYSIPTSAYPVGIYNNNGRYSRYFTVDKAHGTSFA